MAFCITNLPLLKMLTAYGLFNTTEHDFLFAVSQALRLGHSPCSIVGMMAKEAGSNSRQKRIFDMMAGDLAAGKSLGEAMSGTGKFDRGLCSVLTGHAKPRAIAAVIDAWLKWSKRHNKRLGSIYYSGYYLAMGIFAAMFVFHIIMPEMFAIQKGLFIDHPGVFNNSLLLKTVYYLQHSTLIYLLFCLAFLVVVFLMFCLFLFVFPVPRFLRYFPFLRRFVLLDQSILFASQLAVLSSIESSISEILQKAAMGLSYQPLREQLFRLAAVIEQGRQPAGAAGELPDIPPLLLTRLSMGLKDGDLNRAMLEYVDAADTLMARRQAFFVAVAEPAAVVVTALVVFFVLFSTYDAMNVLLLSALSAA